jgi:hypothetical protein
VVRKLRIYIRPLVQEFSPAAPMEFAGLDKNELTLSQMTWISRCQGWLATMSLRKVTNCSLGCGERRSCPAPQRHRPRQALLVERRGPTRDERIVAAELGSNIDAALSVGPQQHAACPTRQRRILVSLAHHGIQFTALLVACLTICGRWAINRRGR